MRLNIKKYMSLLSLSAILLTLTHPTPAQAQIVDNKEYVVKTVAIIETEPNFSINGSHFELEAGFLVKPVMKNNESDTNYMMAPMRDIFKTLSSEYQYDESTGKIILKMNNFKLSMEVGNTLATLNGKKVSAPFAPELLKNEDGTNTLYLPVKFVFENLGADVSWNNGRKRLTATCILVPQIKAAPYKTGGEWEFQKLLNKEDSAYGTEMAQKVADNIIAYQNDDGGWMKHSEYLDMTQTVKKGGNSTVDNNATILQLRYLAKVYTATGIEKYAVSFMKGIDYIVAGQYESGGWPQFFPKATGYYKNITINDNAMSNILQLLIDISGQQSDFQFVTQKYSNKLAVIGNSLEKGIDCILKLQIEVDGKKTGWASQYHPITLTPTFGRAYEMPAIAASESVKVVKFLMSIDNPDEEIINAVKSCMIWFEQVKISGMRVDTKIDYSLERGTDKVLAIDPNSTIWARFYEISSDFRPLFSGRDSVIKYNMADISYERRNGYTWYGDFLQDLPEQYSKWLSEIESK